MSRLSRKEKQPTFEIWLQDSMSFRSRRFGLLAMCFKFSMSLIYVPLRMKVIIIEYVKSMCRLVRCVSCRQLSSSSLLASGFWLQN